MRVVRSILFTVVLISFGQAVQAQLGISFDIKKPRQYQERTLRSEKTGEKKFTAPRRFVQNTVTRFNFYFNANNTLNEVIAEAKTQHKDDYTELLPFYNYSLENTAKNRIQLDSIISRSTTGLVLHDLRNDWADNLYLLIGAAYFLRKDFDSAYLTFQFINYAFAPKEKDGYYQVIGSRFDGNNAMSIATKEKNSLPKKVFAEPPSRNDAFIWQIRTFIAREYFAEAASLIATLRNDPVFPKRLQNDLNEVQALWYYEQQGFDSAAVYLEKALDNAPTKKEKARWEYLVAQMYEEGKNYEKATYFYEKVIGHTIDPVMEIYARLNAIRTNKGSDEKNYADKNIAELRKMARREKYADYRDIIFYSIGQLELEQGRTEEAMAAILESTRYSSNNENQRTRAFLQLGELAYARQNYREAASFYDSIKLTAIGMANGQLVMERKAVLPPVAQNIDIIFRQDSLLRIAALPEEERNEFVRKLVKQLRKQQGLKEEERSTAPLPAENNASTDLFNFNNTKGEWYFYNAALRTKGAADFKTKFGNRPNADNWRRQGAVSMAARLLENNSGRGQVLTETPPNEIGPLTFETLYASLPLDEAGKKKASDSLSTALFELGKAYAEKIEDCSFSIKTLERLRNEFPGFEKMDEALFTLYYCYSKTGDSYAANAVKKQMQDKFGPSRYTTLLTTGKDPGKKNDPDDKNIKTEYEGIYDLFIEGDFQNAITRKKKADSLYGSNYWTPQLLYIEAVYFIQQQEDAQALTSLQNIVKKYPDHALASRSTQLIQALARRKAIEEEIAALPDPEAKEPVTTSMQPTYSPPPKDTLAVSAPVMQVPVTQLPKTGNDSLVAKNLSPDSLNRSNPIQTPPVAGYQFKENEPHYAIIILNKVDKVWGNETNSAFNRYNREKTTTRNLVNSLIELNPETKILLIGSFPDAAAAFDYVNMVKPLAPTRIVPWLTANKYSFSIIGETNLQVLQTRKMIGEYQMFIQSVYPGKF